MPSIFSRILSGEVHGYHLAENDRAYAILDVFPLRRGHVLVIPKKEVDRLFDLDDEDYMAVFALAKKLAPAVKTAFPCDRISVAVIGLEVPHAHVHLVPMIVLRDLDFTQPKLTVSDEDLRADAAAIIAALEVH